MALRFNWLMFTFAAQIVTFLTFLFAFFNMEQHRQSEISELQKELHKARAQQTRANRQLLACTRESATYRAREGADFNENADWENEEGEETPDGTVDGTDDGPADGTGAESTEETRWDSADLSTVDEAAAAEARAAAAEASELAADAAQIPLATLSTAEEPSTAELSEVSTRRDPALAAAATPAILTVATPELLTVEPVVRGGGASRLDGVSLRAQAGCVVDVRGLPGRERASDPRALQGREGGVVSARQLRRGLLTEASAQARFVEWRPDLQQWRRVRRWRRFALAETACGGAAAL